MSLWLNTRGKASVAIAVCDRCHTKAAYSDLVKDPDLPGLRVHPNCADQRDPWKLPPRQTELISLEYPRPDVSIATTVDDGSLLPED
jgi:hypothetical protein